MGLEIRVHIGDVKPRVDGLPANYSVTTLARDQDGILYLIICNSPKMTTLDQKMREIYSQIAGMDLSGEPTLNLEQQMETLLAEEKRVLDVGYSTVVEGDYSLFIGSESKIMKQAEITSFDKLKDTSIMVFYVMDGIPGHLDIPGCIYCKERRPTVLYMRKTRQVEVLI